MVEYEVPDRDGDGKGEVIALVTTITQMTAAPAPLLAQAYHQRWDHETGNAQLKTHLRGPGRVLRSRSPDMVRQEIYGYLLTHYALSALICRAATEAGIDPDRVKFKRTVRVVRRRVADPAAFPPLSTANASSPRSWPTGSNDPATTAPANPDRPRSAWSTAPSSDSQHDQLRLSGIGPWRHDPTPNRPAEAPRPAQLCAADQVP